MIPNTLERQIYKLMYPLVQYQCRPQLQYLTAAHIVKPLVENDFEGFRTPNNLSILTMSLGSNFVMDSKFASTRDAQPPGPSHTEVQQAIEGGGDGRPFRFSIFSRFAKEIREKHQDKLRDTEDLPLIIHLLHAYVINNSNDKAEINTMLETLQKGATDSYLADLDERRVCNLARSIQGLELGKQPGIELYQDLRDAAKKIYLQRFRERQSSMTKESETMLSKENIAVREVLRELGVDFIEEGILEDALFKPDFHIPSLKLLIEINGSQHFYPYSTRFNNFTNLKNKTSRAYGYSTLHLNSWKLEGLIKG
jgi:very-short-patch-repair endonuclease